MLHVLKTAVKAGEAIMDIYGKGTDVEYKDDDSPLTEADKRSHQIIEKALKQEFPNVPILSEEGNDLSYDERSQWTEFWLVDPLDGTKEFIKKNGEFTVNIALVRHGVPVFGVIYAPVLDVMYIGKEKQGAFKITQPEKVLKTAKNDVEVYKSAEAKSLPLYKNQDQMKVVASRSHMSKETEDFIKELEKKHKKVDTVSIGSSLKLCLVAEGKATYYPRYAPTMEWDTGAGQAIVEQAGGKVTVYGSDKALTYNKKELRNPWFLVTRT